MTRRRAAACGPRTCAALGVAVATLVAAVVVALGVRISPDIAALLPDREEGAALRLYARAFGGADPAVVLVRGDDPAAVERATLAAEGALRRAPSVRAVVTSLARPSPPDDPTLVFRLADARARERLAAILSPDGMRARLAETRALLLAPGGAAIAPYVARDPLRLGQALAESGDLLAGARARGDGALATEDGRARLVLVAPRGGALRGAEARAFTADAETALDGVRRASPGVRLELTGGHAIAAATETMLRADLARSSVLSIVLAAVAFLVTFRRGRALLALLPPLAVGTLWTAALAIFAPGGLSAIAVAFAAVVVGVGVDTGVHVYAALLDARRRGESPSEAARTARAETARPVLLAALAAAVAFGSLALSEVSALRQLGLLCAAGEVLTAVAILVLLPEIGARLERGAPPEDAPPRWTALVDRMTRGPRRSFVALAAVAVPALLLAVLSPARLGDAIVAVRPQGLAPIETQRELYRLFGGREGQWVVLVRDDDRERALERADRIAEALAASDAVEGFDALGRFVPSAATQRARLAERDALNLPARADALERLLGELGFDPSRFSATLEALRHPSHALFGPDDARARGLDLLVARHLATDGGSSVAALYVRPRPGAEARAERAILDADAHASITGYARLERALRAALAHDLPRVSVAAALLVVAVLAASLRRARDVALAALVVAVELAAVLGLAGALSLPIHVYDALVLPALLGITVDEGVFLLERARAVGIEDALRAEGRAIAATALTTSAGFAALLACRFAPLRQLGALGALGSAVGLVVAVVVIPAGLRVRARRSAPRVTDSERAA